VVVDYDGAVAYVSADPGGISMPKNRRVTLRGLLFVAAFACSLLIGIASAVAAPVITEAKFTNPVAYELKSLLTTRMYCTVDTPGVWATLTVSNYKGVVKTVYSGAIPTANQRFWMPTWNGMDASGARLPTGVYNWTLTVAKGTTKTTTTGKIAISKINFNVSGVAAAQQAVKASRYMVAGPAYLYVWASTTNSSNNSAFIGVSGTTRPPAGYIGRVPIAWFVFPNNTTYSYYLKDPCTIASKGMHDISVKNMAMNIAIGNTPAPTMTYYLTVIQ